MRMLDLEIAGEFFVMAATLMYIKSRELLPVDQQVQVEGEEEGTIPAGNSSGNWSNTRNSRMPPHNCKVWKSAQEDIFPRRPSKLEFEAPREAAEVSLFDSLNAVNAVLSRIGQKPEAREIFRGQMDRQRKIEYLDAPRFRAADLDLRFSELFAEAHQPLRGGRNVSGHAGIDPLEATGAVQRPSLR